MDWKYSALVLVIFLNYVHDASCQDTKCTGQGVQCTDDCSGIVACVEAGADPIPIHTCDSTDKTLLCQLSADNTTATCDATTCAGPAGGAGLIILCGSAGELPHPTQCGVTVICTGADGTASKGQCKCPANAFIDIMRPSLPCKSGGCPRKPVVCDSPGKFGKIQEGGDYYYICKDEKNVLVFVSDADVTRNLMPDLRASIKKECEEAPAEEGGGGNEDGGSEGGGNGGTL